MENNERAWPARAIVSARLWPNKAVGEPSVGEAAVGPCYARRLWLGWLIRVAGRRRPPVAMPRGILKCAVPDQSAPIAQWIEHLTTDQKVGGSSPSGRAISFGDLHRLDGATFSNRQQVAASLLIALARRGAVKENKWTYGECRNPPAIADRAGTLARPGYSMIAASMSAFTVPMTVTIWASGIPSWFGSYQT